MSRQTKNALYIFFLVILGGIFLYSCNLFDAGIKQIKAAPATSQPAFVVEVSPLPSATATETPIPQPTIDTSYLIPKMTEAEIGKANAESAKVAADAQSTIVSNHATEAAIWAGTPTARAIEAATMQAVQTEKARIGMTETPARQTFLSNMATATKQAGQETQKANLDFIGTLFWYFMAAIVAVSLLVVVVKYIMLKMHKVMFPPKDEAEKNKAEEQLITLDNMIPATQVSSGGNAGFMHEIKITPAEYRMLKAAAACLGGVFSRRKLNGENPTGQKFFVEERAEGILAMLREVHADGIQYAAYVGQMTHLTPEGWAWLRMSPTAPPPEISPILVENTAKTRPTPPQNTEGDVKSGEDGV